MENTTAIRRIAVRETIISQQSCVPNWGHPLKSFGPSQHFRIGEIKDVLLGGLRMYIRCKKYSECIFF